MSTPDRGITPTPEIIRWTREDAQLTQTAAAGLIYSTLRTWQDWEAGIAKMHPCFWESFRAKAARAKARKLKSVA